MSTAITWTLSTEPSQPVQPVAHEEAALVAASLDGDERAFGTLVRQHQKRVFQLAGRFFRKREDLEDAAQETFLTAWSKLHTYRGEAPFEHWLTRVCLNTCYGRLRKARPEVALLDIDVQAPKRDPNARVDVSRLLAKLPAKDRFILLLLDGEGWTTQEIANKIGWSRSNVKVRAFRARKKLRKILEADLASTPGSQDAS